MLMAPEENKTYPETAERREKIAALDVEFAENFKTQFSVIFLLSTIACPSLIRRI